MDINTVCATCKTEKTTEITFEDWKRYVNGELVQQVWPNKTSSEREIIIGYKNDFYLCDACWSINISEAED